MYLSAEKVLVGLSCVQTLQHLSIIPFAPGQTDDHLHSLRPNEVMLHWFAGYGNDGFWSAQNSALTHLLPTILQDFFTPSGLKCSAVGSWRRPLPFQFF